MPCLRLCLCVGVLWSLGTGPAAAESADSARAAADAEATARTAQAPAVVSAAQATPQLHWAGVGDLGFRRHVGLGVASGTLDPFAAVRKVLGTADITFGNLETVLTRRAVPDPQATGSWPIIKGPPEGAKLLAQVGFDVVSVANNHAFDLYAAGFRDTLKYLAEAKVAAVGGGTTRKQALTPFVRTVRGVRVGLLAFAVGTNRPAHGDAHVAKPWDLGAFAAVQSLRSSVDVLLVSLHWGTEGVSTPNARQIQLAHALIDAGADVILGHHPHVLQSVELYRNRPVIYSLGNFLFGTQTKPRRQTVILHLDLGPGPHPVKRVALQPVLIDAASEVPNLAVGDDAAEITTQLRKISRSFRTAWKEQDGMLEVLLSPPSDSPKPR